MAVANVLSATVLETPPNVVEGAPFAAIAELFKVGRIGNRIRALGLDLSAGPSRPFHGIRRRQRSVLARQILSPLDLERTFGLIGGDIFHGSLDLRQLFSARPMLGYADYRGPITGLYLCGAGAHPGGGVTGAPGHNAAREILHDFRHRRIARTP